ncbi:MAG: hypothetical protein M3237_16715 [Actinomycetota bacterium]|nr:hypothetical protein [Actinomycetota bacterium]
MADHDPTPTPRGDHPVLTGLIALVGVAVVVGLILGGAVLAGTKVLGIGDDGSATDDASSGDSLHLPRPELTTEPSDPLVTFASPDETERTRNSQESETAKPKTEISLSAAQTTATPMEQIDLTGVFPGGEGAILQVQRFEAGSWEDFPVTVEVSNATFATYIQTSQTGLNRFRVIDTESRETSNEVRVTIS